MKKFAEALMQSKSFKERQDRLCKSLDHLSFYYPDLYTQLFREIKKREVEANDINRITKWLCSSTSNSYIKLYESLMLVKSNNLMAKDEYKTNLKHMLCQTLANGTNIEEATKICCLIEKSPHLTSIYKSLIYLIQRVKQLSAYKRDICLESRIVNFTNNFSQHIQLNSFRQSNYQPINQEQQQNTVVWSNMLQPNILKAAHGFPHFSLECFGYDHLEVVATANKFHATFDLSQTITNITIVSQEMDGSVTKWLHYLKLHKYQWFFNDLSYLEIEFIDEDNIEWFIAKVNKNSITKGAQKKICISTKALRDRKQKFQDLLMALDLDVTPVELCENITYMRDILHYPIPNKNCVVGDHLQQDIVLVMEKFLNQLLEKLSATSSLIAHSLLGMSINKYLECTLLITGNQIFMKHQIYKTFFFGEKLKYKVLHTPRNFN